MKRDKAIIKLVVQRSQPFPAGLEDRLWSAINANIEKRRKRDHVVGIMLVSLVSLFLIGAAVLIMRVFFSTGLSFDGGLMKWSEQTTGLLVFSSYIAVIVLFLLVMDVYLRNIRRQSNCP